MKIVYTATLKTFFLNKSLALLSAGLLVCSLAGAQTAGNWTFNGTLNGTPGSSLSVSNVSLGSGIPTNAFNGGTEFFGENGWPAGAVDPNAYFEFSLTASVAHYLVLNKVNLTQRRSNTGTPAGSGPTAWSLRSSLDNYATNITTGTMTDTYATYAVTLPAAFQAIASKVTFRVYGYTTTISSGGTSRFVIDNISVTGSSMSGVLAEAAIQLNTSFTTAGKPSIQWNTSGFEAGTDFTVERSVNGIDFAAIHQEQSNTSTDAAYQYTDLSAPAAATLFYRVSASNQGNGNYLSPVAALKQGVPTSAQMSTQIRGIIAGGASVKTFLHMEEAGAYQLSIWSMDGKALVSQTLQGQAGDAIADLTLGARPHGVYVLTLSKEGQRSSRQFVY